MTNQKSIDTPSHLGQFGWERICQDEAVPVIVRSNDVRYSPVRIVETEIIKKFDVLPQSVFQCITLKSFYLTAAEAKLLNNINFNHCNNRYGDGFFSTKDVIISANDVKELSRFLKISRDVFTPNLISKYSQKLGVVKITLDPQSPTSTMLAPYITKAVAQQDSSTRMVRFVPLKLVEPFEFHFGTSVRAEPNDWDIMYLKMLAIYCENNSQHYITQENKILSLEGLVYKRTNSPLIYEDYVSQSYQT